MKKYLIVLAAAVVALASCNKGGGNKYTSIKFKESQITIAEGQSQKLYLVWEPTSLEAPVCTWASSNEDVVLVDKNGNIGAIAEGVANITATLTQGDEKLEAVCQVTVTSAQDLFEWGGVALFELDKDSIIGEPYQHWDEDDQCYYKVQNCYGYFAAWSSTLLFTDGQGFSGYGYLADIEVPVAIIQEGQWAGYYYTPVLTFSDTLDITAEGACPAGALTDAEKWGQALTDSTYEGETSFKGAPVSYYDFDNKQQVPFVGFVGEGAMAGDDTEVYYSMTITWFENTEEAPSAYGLLIEQDPATGKWDLKKPFTFAERFTQQYNRIPNASSAAHKQKPAVINPEQLRMIKNMSKTDFHYAR